MLYTKSGDNGTTQFFGCDQRFSKSSKIAEALGSLDEINSFLGWCKVKTDSFFSVAIDNEELSFEQIIDSVQQDLFIAQAEIAGADKSILAEKTVRLENIIDQIEKNLPPIKTFIVPGGTEFAGMLDFARTISRRTERTVVEAREEGKVKISETTVSFLNRLSSLLYALARYANTKSGVKEENPHY
jgi:cob(I)alamin adenosyltransferase